MQLKQFYPQYGVGYYCSLFGRSRQGWYEQIKNEDEQHMANAIVLKLVSEIREDLPRVGVQKIHFMLQDKLQAHRIKIGRGALYELLGMNGYLIRYRKRKPYTTNSNHPYKKYPNLIRNIKYLTHPGQLWVSDITYIRLKERFCYLSIITDAYSHKIIGHCLYPTLHSNGPVNALLMALKAKQGRSLIHHSDRGSQYCCADYIKILDDSEIQISMTENGDPYENAIAERVNGILKGEFLLDKSFSSFNEADEIVKSAIEKYNHIRPHASCDNLTPVQAQDHNGILRKRWKTQAEHELLIS